MDGRTTPPPTSIGGLRSIIESPRDAAGNPYDDVVPGSEHRFRVDLRGLDASYLEMEGTSQPLSPRSESAVSIDTMDSAFTIDSTFTEGGTAREGYLPLRGKLVSRPGSRQSDASSPLSARGYHEDGTAKEGYEPFVRNLQRGVRPPPMPESREEWCAVAAERQHGGSPPFSTTALPAAARGAGNGSESMRHEVLSRLLHSPRSRAAGVLGAQVGETLVWEGLPSLPALAGGHQ